MQVLARCPPAAPVVLGALAEALRPPARLGVAEAAVSRVVPPESGTRWPGKWQTERTPYLKAIMDALGSDDPAEDVVIVSSAQIGKSEVGINFFHWIVTQQPGPAIVVLPSYEEAKKWVRTKLQPTIDATPGLRRRVLEMSNRTEQGSTSSFKQFRGGFAQVTFAGSSRGLQMLSAKYVIADEVSEWPAESGDRGDPVAQVRARTVTFERERKMLFTSTPGLSGACRITELYETSDQRKFYLPCPHCGAWQVLRFDRLRWESDIWPHRAWFECAASGCVIEHVDKPAMLAAGVWIATAGEDGPREVISPEDIAHWQVRAVQPRRRGFHLWQAYSRATSWDSIVARWLSDKDNADRLRTFTQQVLGEAFEESGDAPDAEKLLARRVQGLRKGIVPPQVAIATGATDVQGAYLQWALWGWSEGPTWWLIDWGVIEGDTLDPAVWRQHDEIVAATWTTEDGRPLKADIWAVDSGFHSQTVYRYAQGRPDVLAVDGRSKQNQRMHPMVGAARPVTLTRKGKPDRRVSKMLWPVGSWPLKSALYGAIRKTIEGPTETGALPAGCVILPEDVDHAYCDQLTAEYIATKQRANGRLDHEWRLRRGVKNEALDTACYARAAAELRGVGAWSGERWAQEREKRLGPPVTREADLFTVAVDTAVDLRPAPAEGRESTARDIATRLAGTLS